jgi:hypothetical protein
VGTVEEIGAKEKIWPVSFTPNKFGVPFVDISFEAREYP